MQPVVSVGRIERLEAFPFRHIEARPIDVWLPDDYTPSKRYAVLYMQDGQGLFDASQAWNQQAWNVHLALAPEAVRTDYVRRAQLDRPLADAYLRFVVEELKPIIDQRYATLRAPAGHTEADCRATLKVTRNAEWLTIVIAQFIAQVTIGHKIELRLAC